MMQRTGLLRRLRDASRGADILAAALTSVAAMALGLPAAGAAQDCLDAAQSLSFECAEHVRPSRLDDLLAADHAHGRLDSRLDGTPWIAQEWVVSPIAVSPSSPSLSVKTSVLHWSAHASHVQAQRAEKAKALAPEGMQMPKPGAPRSAAFDVWTALDLQSLDPDTARGVRGSVGADYKIAPGAVVGIAVDLRDGQFDDAPGSETNHALAAFFAMKVNPSLTLDTTALWGVGGGSVAGHAFSTRDSAIQGRLRGEWRYDRMTFAPTLAVRHGVEHVERGDDDGQTARSSVTVAPQVSRPFQLADGRTIEPFVRYREEWSVGTIDRDGGEQTVEHLRSAGAGFRLAKPETYSLSLSADVEGAEGGAETQPNVKSQIQLKVPLR